MLAPGIPRTSDRYDVTVAASPTAASHLQGGFGLAADGTLYIDSDAPSGSLYLKGFRVNATGCIFGTTSTNASDVWNAGLRCSVAGAVVYEAAAAVAAVNGDPLTANGLLAVG